MFPFFLRVWSITSKGEVKHKLQVGLKKDNVGYLTSLWYYVTGNLNDLYVTNIAGNWNLGDATCSYKVGDKERLENFGGESCYKRQMEANI
jgi:hypothetical protein